MKKLSGPLNLVCEGNTSYRISFACDGDEIEFLDEIAGDYKVSRGVILRTLIRDALGPHYEQRLLKKKAAEQKPQPKNVKRARRS